MTDAIKALRNYLSKSPSVVYPQDVLEYLPAIEAENAKLLELVRIMHSELVSCEDNGYVCGGHKFDGRMRELGVEVD